MGNTASTTKRPPVTLAQVAALAGVSQSTVSKVLNGGWDVSARTRQQVQALLVEHQYVRRGSSRVEPPPVIDLVFQELDGPWAMEIVGGAVRATAQVGLKVALTSLSDGPTQSSWLDQICARGTRGVIRLLGRLSQKEEAEFNARGVPYAVVDHRGEPDPTVPTVGATNWAGGFTATRHLIELGHERIGIITGPADLWCSRARMDGYRSAMDAAGLGLGPELMRWSNFYVDGGFKEGLSLLALADRPTAIFAGNDLQALGVLEAARITHIKVPSQLSLVGFDDLPLSRWTSPPLTTVRQPLAEMAATAVNLVLAQGRGESTGAPSIELATTLVTRETTAPVSP